MAFKPREEIIVVKGLRLEAEMYCGEEFDNENSLLVNWKANANVQRSQLDGNTVFVFTDPSGPANLVLRIEQDGVGGHTVTWPANVMWEGGTPPVISAAALAIDVATFYFNGTDYYGSIQQDFS